MNEVKSFYKTALVLSPHTDDGELATGGTIKRLIESGSSLYFVAFSGLLIFLAQ